MKRIHRDILALSVPAVIASVTTPLLGLMDTAFTGHMGGAVYLAGIALGGNLFNLIYWLFGFLRMGTSGLTAQAVGSADSRRQWLTLYRSLAVAAAAGLALIALQGPVASLYMFLTSPEPQAWQEGLLYFRILIWGAPAFLATVALSGWFIGMARSSKAMWMSIAIDVINLAVSATLVAGIGMKVPGVAIGTLAAQWGGLGAGLLMVRSLGSFPRFSLAEIFDRAELKRFASVNRDIFLRTLCLIAVTLWFTREGARQGSTMLAANALLMQLFILFSFFMDGLAYAGEALAGSRVGAGDVAGLKATVRALVKWGAAVAVVFTVIYFFCGEAIMRLLSDDEGVRAAAADYLPWAVTIPLMSFMAFTWDGVFIGATATRSMLGSMALSTALFFILIAALSSLPANTALWIAFLAFLLCRSVTLSIAFSSRKSWKPQ
ncbi:MAG: MATE family efflux transporter [Bacteroides sp.]|nr:MATE family efflux transporter [Bacteroides sp.]